MNLEGLSHIPDLTLAICLWTVRVFEPQFPQKVTGIPDYDESQIREKF